MIDPNDAANAVRIARAVLDGSVSIYLGCRQLVGPLNRLGVHRDEPFVVIAGVDSEIDESPVRPKERSVWNADALVREDAKLAAWLPAIRPHVLAACEEVVRSFGHYPSREVEC